MPNRVLVKLRPSAALRAADPRVNLRPLGVTTSAADFGLDGGADWFAADLPEDAATPWDLAHARLADRLGVDESDVVFAEPDLPHRIYPDANERDENVGLGVDECTADQPDADHGKPKTPADFAWHLGPKFSQLGDARDDVRFVEPRTRIAHIDTGYFRAHRTCPIPDGHPLERNFVRGDGKSGDAQDPDNFRLLLDNSGHGTGTLSLLAGRKKDGFEPIALGGAVGADVVPLRIADSVVLFWTSALYEALTYAVAQGCDVATLSMGGLPSRLWNEAIDAAYERGLCLVAAAGNNVNGRPTRHIVYPARYRRVIAVCGVMANLEPYVGLAGPKTLEGNYGPDSHMTTAIAAFTPNVPWARYPCADVIRLNGEGTSSATPQVAAAVALWFEKYKGTLPRDWRRIEAVRHALFSTATKLDGKASFLGNGIVRAHDALGIAPRLDLKQTPKESDSFAFLRVLTGLGIAETPPREAMFNLELAQRWLVNRDLQALVPDPAATRALDDATRTKVMDVLINDGEASVALRKHVAERYPAFSGKAAPLPRRADLGVAKEPPACEARPAVRPPTRRRLRIYAVDPSFSTRLATAGVNEVTLAVPWEPLPGPLAGEYFAIDDVDPSNTKYAGVQLDDPSLLAQDGWAPSEGNAQFHQQMVYAVAMKTVEHFERALGRRVLWRHRPNAARPSDDSHYVQRLVLRPHALHRTNAFYSPQDVALKFGYFEAAEDDPGDHVPGSRVYSCLSHDIITHETTHAILDGIYPDFNEPTNPDMLALHEAFADIVALMQHFTMPEILAMEIRNTRGNLEAESILGSLAVQFGRASGRKGALRNAIGSVQDGVWRRMAPDPAELARRLTPHGRGAILVAAVFDAFIAIYKARTADLLRLATGGTGVLPDGAIHPDLVTRLANEAATAAGHVLNMCIRALDYLPPVDVTFFEYLRGLITADTDFVGEDRYNYRVAFVEAFRQRGIYPIGMDIPDRVTSRTLSVDTLRWGGIDMPMRGPIADGYRMILANLKQYANACLYLDDRKILFDVAREHRRLLHDQLAPMLKAAPRFAARLGLAGRRPFQVRGLRAAIRTRSDGKQIPQIIVSVMQSQTVPADRATATPEYVFRSGSTFVVDLLTSTITYQIGKGLRGGGARGNGTRQARTAELARRVADDPLLGLFFAADRPEPFAALHSLIDDE